MDNKLKNILREMEIFLEKEEDDENKEEKETKPPVEEEPSEEEDKNETPDALPSSTDTDTSEDNDSGSFGGSEDDNDEEEDETYIDVSNKYILNKLYDHLYLLSDQLAMFSNKYLRVIQNYVINAIEYLDIVVQNLNVYKDKIDDIVSVYLKFLKIVTVKMNEIVKDQNKSDEDDMEDKAEKIDKKNEEKEMQ